MWNCINTALREKKVNKAVIIESEIDAHASHVSEKEHAKRKPYTTLVIIRNWTNTVA